MKNIEKKKLPGFHRTGIKMENNRNIEMNKLLTTKHNMDNTNNSPQEKIEKNRRIKKDDKEFRTIKERQLKERKIK